MDEKRSTDGETSHVNNAAVQEKTDTTNSEGNTHVVHFKGQTPEWRDATEKKLLRKIDTHLLPFLVVMYLLNFLDRSNLAQARQGTFEKDLGMTGTDFNLATSIFFVAYLLMQLPSNMLITRVRPSLYLSAAMVLWGGVSACTAATRNFGQLIAVRFLLGFVEAPFFPGAGARGIAGWQWLFIIEGVITIAVAVAAAFVLPDYPSTTRWLTEEERAFAAWRLLADINESDAQKARTVWEGVKLAATDPRLYLFVLLQHLSLLSQTFQYFFPGIVGTLGYGKIETLWLTAPVWFATFLISVCVTWTSARTQDRSIHIFCLMMLAAVGNAIATGSTALGARFFAMFLMPMGAVSAYQIIVSWVANSFPRPLVKRSASVAIANMIGNTASIYGSYMYPASNAPQYTPGGATNTIVCVLVGVLALLMRFVHKRANRKLEDAEAELAENRHGEISRPANGDKRAVGFRYVH
ncbi:major facilitator superfamily transporter [Lasiosphaeria miniovina]|uniref:Major facilitator superfamily transporter n=1 Tax=Lasiosphaeria miniovina TaxID=1954250 RepID=A0AA39ZZ40_9PEZI|nr:major facilitator superfamily transporter [Lasiosphaeria miniovina]KAK0706274.1 major facilitator superfamily transporter [Lasiosphaeria miniovina]